MAEIDTATPSAGGDIAVATKGSDAPSRESGSPTPEAATGGTAVERRPGENPSEARARALGFLEEEGDGGGAFETAEEGDDEGALTETEVETEPERFPWQRPENLSDDDALAEWKEAQGLPVSAEGYGDQLELPEGTQITEPGRQIVGSFLHFAVDNDLPPPVVSKAIQWFTDTQRIVIKERDSASKEEATEALRDRWEDAFDDNLSVATAGLQSLPEPLQKVLRAARGPDGRKLLHDPEMAQLLFDLGARAEQGDSDQSASSEAKAMARQQAGLRKELEAIGTLLRTDVDAYRSRPWKATKMTAGERAVEIRRQLQNPKSPSGQKAALGAEREELERMQANDPEVFELGRWRGGKQTPAQRLDDILSGLA